MWLEEIWFSLSEWNDEKRGQLAAERNTRDHSNLLLSQLELLFSFFFFFFWWEYNFLSDFLLFIYCIIISRDAMWHPGSLLVWKHIVINHDCILLCCCCCCSRLHTQSMSNDSIVKDGAWPTNLGEILHVFHNTSKYFRSNFLCASCWTIFHSMDWMTVIAQHFLLSDPTIGHSFTISAQTSPIPTSRRVY